MLQGSEDRGGLDGAAAVVREGGEALSSYAADFFTSLPAFLPGSGWVGGWGGHFPFLGLWRKPRSPPPSIPLMG